MILVDAATGSNELYEPLKKAGLPVDKTHLEYGDVVFSGRGEGGQKLYIGIELKKISELVQSLTSKRFQGHQLLGLVKDFDRRYLLIEGDYHSDMYGRPVVFRGRGKPKPLPGMSSAIALEQELINIQTRGGVWVWRTTTRRDTLRFIEACYRYWTDKDLDEHKSHLAVYAPDMDKGLLAPPSDFRRMLVTLLPGIGFSVSKAVEQRCQGSLRRLLALTENEWADIATTDRNGKTKRLGASRAKQIVATLEAMK